jgi:glycogen phosphorylase
VNTLRLWSPRLDPIRLDAFNSGDYLGGHGREQQGRDHHPRALSGRRHAGRPGAAAAAGVFLHLRIAAGLIRRHLQQFGEVRSLAEKVAIQLNDTHPAIAVAELMRSCCRRHGFDWDEAWEITRKCLGYTNHTLLPEALEKLARPPVRACAAAPHADHLRRSTRGSSLDAQKRPDARASSLASVSLIDEHNGRRVRMGQLALCGFAFGQRRFGPAHLADEGDACSATCTLYPGPHQQQDERHHPRRWLIQAPIRSSRPAEREHRTRRRARRCSRRSKPFEVRHRRDFRERFEAIKPAQQGRARRDLIAARDGHVGSIPSAMFDVHVKRIHEYKRQLLNILETIALYNAIKANPDGNWAPRVKIFAGKAAPAMPRPSSSSSSSTTWRR